MIKISICAAGGLLLPFDLNARGLKPPKTKPEQKPKKDTDKNIESLSDILDAIGQMLAEIKESSFGDTIDFCCEKCFGCGICLEEYPGEGIFPHIIEICPAEAFRIEYA